MLLQKLPTQAGQYSLYQKKEEENKYGSNECDMLEVGFDKNDSFRFIIKLRDTTVLEFY